MSARYLPNIGSKLAGNGPADVGDHFAPTIIVGNTLAGDPALAQTAPFRYIPDPGDGTGIQTALAEALATPQSWVHIRRGIYTLDAAVLPLAIPALTRVTGDGIATTLVQRADDRRVFTIAGGASELSHMGIQFVQAAPGATGTAMIDASLTAAVRISGLFIDKGVVGVVNTDESLSSIIYCGAQTYVIDNQVYGIDDNPNGSVVAVVRIDAENCDVRGNVLTGGDYGILETVNGFYVRVLDNIISGANQGGSAQAGVQLGGGNTVCTGNIIQGATIGVVSEGDANIINSNGISGGGLTAISLSAASSNNLVIGNSVGGAAVVDAGAGNDVAHNV